MASSSTPQGVTHKGGCHCQGVRFTFQAPADLVAWDCNCSICAMKRNTHVMIPKGSFQLLQGEDLLSCYQFGTRTARHLFCKVCGVCSFYSPRSNPDCWAVTIHCVDPGSMRSVEVRSFHGQHWEQAYQGTGIAGAAAALVPAAAAQAGGGGNGGGHQQTQQQGQRPAG